jgi:DNA-binding response OmpR family regulator
MTAKVLLVEDDADLVRALKVNLTHEGYEVSWAKDGEEGFNLACRGGHDLVLLDLMLPKMDGFEVLRRLRESGSRVPVICLTARGQESDVVAGLSLGADDYVVKPFSVAELMARIEAALRRSPTGPAQGVVALGAVKVDLKALTATREDESVVELTPIELDILRYLLDRRGRAVPREEVLKDLWGLDRFATTRTLDNHVARLRKKLEPDAERPTIILTVHGVGYRIP